ncbi:MAG: hypothetical protein AABY04_00305 [Candidatus Micrarchaeota archaeon]
MLFLALFAIAALISDQIKFSALWGASNQFFTAFQFIGPIAGGFLGVAAGAVSVLFAELISFAYLGKEASLLNVLRLAPMIFAAIYFAKFGAKFDLKNNKILLVPIAAILLFITHPVGSQVWYYSMFWTIPLIAAFLLPNNLFARSLGTTFTAHSVGGIVWLMLVPTTPAFWAALIPVVLMERMAFAAGISVSFVAFNTVLSKVESLIPAQFVKIDRRYALFGTPAPAKLLRK